MEFLGYFIYILHNFIFLHLGQPIPPKIRYVLNDIVSHICTYFIFSKWQAIYPPPPLNGGAIKKIIFLCGFPYSNVIYVHGAGST